MSAGDNEQSWGQVLALTGSSLFHTASWSPDSSRLAAAAYDLVFGNDDAIGDVKYRLSSGKIETSHLYQLTSFAAGYRSRHGLLIDFGPDSGSDHVEIGSIRVAAASWDIELQNPNSAAEKLCAQVERWLSSEVTA